MGVAKIHKQAILTSRRSQKISIECQYLGSVYEGFKRRSIVQPHTPYLYGGRARYATRSCSTMTGHVFSPYQKLRTCPFCSSLVRQRRLLRVARRAECLSAHVLRIHSGCDIYCRWVFKRRQDYATPGGLPSLVLVY